MTPRWQDVRCARIRVEDLSVLADLRREVGIRVTVAEGRAWICWDDPEGSEATRRILVERLLPLAGVETFVRRDGWWYRSGEHLPAFDVPIGDGSSGAAIGRAIVPGPMAIVDPPDDVPRPVPLRLVRETSGCSRPASAIRCRLADLAGWADTVPSFWIEALVGAWRAPAGGDPDRAEVFVLGPSHRDGRTEPCPHGSPRAAGVATLPTTADGRRYWGRGVLIPMGYRTEPELPQRAIREGVGAQSDDLVVFDAEGPELIPRRAFRPLSRASLRLARMDPSARPAMGGGEP